MTNFCTCGSCKKPISLGQKYFACTVSTCKKTAYCSMGCFDDHVSVFRHKDAWAEEHFAPKTLVTRQEENIKSEIPKNILVVASKLKDYIKATSQMSTSSSVMDKLSDVLRKKCDEAIERARSDNRKTVMDRDFS